MIHDIKCLMLIRRLPLSYLPLMQRKIQAPGFYIKIQLICAVARQIFFFFFLNFPLKFELFVYRYIWLSVFFPLSLSFSTFGVLPVLQPSSLFFRVYFHVAVVHFYSTNQQRTKRKMRRTGKKLEAED